MGIVKLSAQSNLQPQRGVKQHECHDHCVHHRERGHERARDLQRVNRWRDLACGVSIVMRSGSYIGIEPIGCLAIEHHEHAEPSNLWCSINIVQPREWNIGGLGLGLTQRVDCVRGRFVNLRNMTCVDSSRAIRTLCKVA